VVYAIFKYAVPTKGVALVAMPKGARILRIEVQAESTQCWAIVDQRQPLVQRRFLGFTPGSELPSGDPGKYIGTVLYEGGSFVLHWFDGGEIA